MYKQLTIIVPVYNEEGNMEQLSSSLEQFMENSNAGTKVLFVNDGSEDNSQVIIEKICERNKDFSFIEFEGNTGLSAALKAGFDHVDTPLTGYIDADLQTNPQDFNLLLEFADEYDLVTGVRSTRKDNFLKRISSIIANKIRNIFTHDGMDDTGCPLKIIKTELSKKIPMFKGLHRFLPAMILLQNGKIKQVPVRHYKRVSGKSSFGLISRIPGPLSDCFAYLWMKKKYIRYKVKSSR